ncbi:MAG TPA: tryptophan synthase subunit beta [Vicinamibacteria bacterium]|nr:tryptophan synthase subunit beta [Vicinamibacteria bacterium]
MSTGVRPKVGAFGEYGGRYVPELLVPALDELERALREIVPSRAFQSELSRLLADWVGRPTPLMEAPAFSEACGLEVVMKREELLHGGAHKTNNVAGQALLTRYMGKKRVIAETGAGQHGCATAMAAARLGLEAVVYMGEKDIERQAPNVKRMELCGASVVSVRTGSRTLKDAINEALRDWTQNLETTHYLLGTVCGPHPFPTLVRDFQAIIGKEARGQWRKRYGTLPEAVVACVGGGSNAMGIFHAFVRDDGVQLIGVEPGGRGLETREHGATLVAGRPGLLHGARTSVLQDDEGQILEAHSVSAGLDYPGVGPEHAYLRDIGRARYVAVTDEEALEAFEQLSELEGIIPAFEPAHALAFLLKAVRENELRAGAHVLMNLCGRGDKDLETYFRFYAGRRRDS